MQAKRGDVLRKAVRVRILGWLSGEPEPRTKREIGKALSMSNASVHFHMKQLEKAGLVKLEGTRLGSNSVMEKLYSGSSVTNPDESGLTDLEKSEFYLSYTLDSIHELHREGEQLIRSDWKKNRFIVGTYGVYANEGEIREFKNKLFKLIDDFHKSHSEASKDAKPIAITFGIVPSKAAAWLSTQKVFDMLS